MKRARVTVRGRVRKAIEPRAAVDGDLGRDRDATLPAATTSGDDSEGRETGRP